MSPTSASRLLVVLVVLAVSSAIGVSTTNILAANFALTPNSYLRASNFSLVMQEDCDLVLYNRTQAVYKADRISFNPEKATYPSRNCVLAMQADANLVIYNGSTTINNALWSSSTMQSAMRFSYYLELQNDGQMNIYDASGSHVPLAWVGRWEKLASDYKPPVNVSIADTHLEWQPPSLNAVHSFMYVGYHLASGSSIASISGRFTLTMGRDCNLKVDGVKRGFEALVWESGTSSFGLEQNPCRLTLEQNGNLVILGKSMNPVWNSSVSGVKTVNWVLIVNDRDGHLAVVDLSNPTAILWSSGSDPSSPRSSPSSSTMAGPVESIATASSVRSVSTSSVVTNSVIFRATVGACFGVIFLLSIAVVTLVCYIHARRRAATDKAVGRDDENTGSWEKSSFAAVSGVPTGPTHMLIPR